MLSCVNSTKVIGQARQGGLVSHRTARSPVLGISIITYYREGAGYASERSVMVQYQDNGEVAEISCSGIIGSTLDAIMPICTDAGPSTRTDQATVRTWALHAGATLLRKPTSVLKLSTSGMLFAACADAQFPPGQPIGKPQMRLFVASPTGVFNPSLCYRG